jgi:Flp pilus assembly protein TadD
VGLKIFILKRGDSLLSLGEYQKAINEFTTVIEFSPTEAYPYSKSAFAYLTSINTRKL